MAFFWLLFASCFVRCVALFSEAGLALTTRFSFTQVTLCLQLRVIFVLDCVVLCAFVALLFEVCLHKYPCLAICDVSFINRQTDIHRFASTKLLLSQFCLATRQAIVGVSMLCDGAFVPCV